MLEAAGVPIVAHEVKPLLVARFADDTTGPATPVAFDTQIAAYLLNAALRSPDDRRRRGRAPRSGPAAGQGAPGRRARAAWRPCRRWPSGSRSRRRSKPRVSPTCSATSSCRWCRCWRGWRRSAWPSTSRPWRSWIASSQPRSTRLERAIFDAVGHEFTIGSPKQLGRGAVRRAATAQGPQDQDRLLDRRDGPRGARRTSTRWSSRCSTGGPTRSFARRTSRRCRALIADDGRAPHDVPPGRGGDGTPVLVRPEPPEHPDPDAARPPDPPRVRGRRPGPRPGRRRLLPDRAPDHRPRLGRRAPRARPSRARPTSIARPRPASSTRRPRTSPATSARWPRWSTSGWPTG